MVFGGGSVRADQRRRSNLGADHTSFVGREEAIAELARLLDRARVVTMVGAAGVGKTRTAREVARERAEETIAFVDLSAALDADDVVRSVAAALELRLSSDLAPEEAAAQMLSLLDRLGATLIVLDNFEHLVHARELVEGWANATERTRFLVTSRQPLDLEEESVFELSPLRPSEAIALFESRARMVRHDFTVHSSNRNTIARVVEQLDHLPLAIELAAARVSVLSPEALLDRLCSRFELLADSTAPLDARQATLHNAIEWSWHLLTPWEQSALAQCSIFRGGFDLLAAEQIVDISEHPVAPRLIDVVQSLRTKSLLHSWSPAAFPNEVRFDLYESVRMFAWDVLAASDVIDQASVRHARRYLAVAQSWIDALDLSSDARARADLELDNLLIAQRRNEAAHPELSVQLGLTLDRLLPGRSPYRLRRSVLDRAVAAGEAAEDPHLLGKALFARGNFERLLQPNDAAIADIGLAERLAIECGACVLEGEAIFARAKIAADRGDLERATEGYRRAQEIFSSEGVRRQEGEVLGCLGIVYFYRGQLAEAQSLFERALELHRLTSNVRAEGITLANLAALCEERGSLGAARAHYRRAKEIHEQVGNRRSEGIVLANLGNLHRREARFEEAKAAYKEALAIHREVKNRRSEAIVLGCLGALSIEEENLDAARAWLDSAIDLANTVGAARSAGVDRVRLAIVDHLEGDLARAKDGFSRAAQDLEAIGDRRHAALARGHLGAVLAELGSIADAEKTIDSARTTLLVLSDVQLAAAIEVLASALDVAKQKIGPLEKLLHVERSIPASEARVAELVIKSILARVRARLRHQDALTVGPEGRWFRIAEQEVSLERRRNLRLMVDALARLRTEQPGAGLTVHELFEEGWPGITASAESSAHRVYVAIAELRRMGLGAVLVTRDDGYLFDPNVRLIRQ